METRSLGVLGVFVSVCECVSVTMLISAYIVEITPPLCPTISPRSNGTTR